MAYRPSSWQRILWWCPFRWATAAVCLFEMVLLKTFSCQWGDRRRSRRQTGTWAVEFICIERGIWVQESTKSKHPQLGYEAKLLRHLQGPRQLLQIFLQIFPKIFLHEHLIIAVLYIYTVGFAKVHHFETENDWNILVMEYLGSSLEDTFNLCSRSFSLKTILMLATHMVNIL